jgi:DNA-binding transcriptional regulator YiaG
MKPQLHGSTIGGEVKASRERRLLTQDEVAAELGVSLRTIQNWEAGMAPLFRHQRAILAWLEEREAA